MRLLGGVMSTRRMWLGRLNPGGSLGHSSQAIGGRGIGTFGAETI